MTRSQKHLRPMERTDLEQVLLWRNHPDVRSYMYTQHPITWEEHRDWFERLSHIPQRHLLIYEQDSISQGFVNLNVVDQMASRAQWGFYLAPGAPRGSGDGLGGCILSHAFDRLGLHKLCGEVLAGNDRSIRYHERLGFSREARLRDHYYDGTVYHDVIGFGLLVEEWRAFTGAAHL